MPSSSQDQRRQKPRERERQTSYPTLEATVREAGRQESCCHAAASAAAATLRALPSASPGVQVGGATRPKDGPGRPRIKQPRGVKARRYGLQGTRHERAEVSARKGPETGGVVLRTNGPPEGEMAQRAGEVLWASQEPHGVEQNVAFLQDPIMGNRLFLKKPARREALGGGFLLALLRWRLVERALRTQVETTGSTLTGWDKKEPQKPTAFMLMTTCAAVMVITGGGQRRLAHPLATIQQQDRLALRVPATSFTAPQRREQDEAGNSRSQNAPGC